MSEEAQHGTAHTTQQDRTEANKPEQKPASQQASKEAQALQSQLKRHGAGREVKLVRNLLPPLIMLVVAAIEWLILLLPTTLLQYWAHLLFYGLLGPSVTFFTVDWIAKGMRAREKAEKELHLLYLELSASHERLRGVQELMRSLSETSDMPNVLEVASQGVVRVTGASHAQVSFQGLSASARGHTLLAAPSADLQALRLPLAGTGELLLHFEAPPSPETKMLSEAIAAEISSSIEAARQRTIDFLTLYSVDQSIKAERNMRKLLARVTEIMSQRLNVGCRAVFLADTDGVLRLEYMHYADGTSPDLRGSPAPPFVLRAATAEFPTVANTAEAKQVFPCARGALALTMHDEQGLLGVLLLGDRNKSVFESLHVASSRVRLLAFMAGQATRAIRNARAYLYSEELAISDERARIAREIHDSVAQSLAFVALRLDVVSRQVETKAAQQEIITASHLLREQIREVRRSIFALRPTDLEKHGLLETVRLYVTDFGQQNDLKASVHIEGDIRLSPTDEAVMFRILQESLHNIAKHARASEVQVSLTGAEMVELQVRDNGIGFDLEQISGRVSSVGGLGLMQMRERLEARGGRYQLSSQLGGGTKVYASLPQSG